jgi:hypothetical protein
MKDKIKRISKENCEKWAANPLINPITSLAIKKDGPTYKNLEEACAKYSPGQTSKTGLPKKIKGVKAIFTMPQNKKEWKADEYTGKFFRLIDYMLINLRIISETDYNNFPAYIQICELGLENDIVPDDEIENVKNYIDTFKDNLELDLLKPGNLENTDITIIKKEYLQEWADDYKDARMRDPRPQIHDVYIYNIMDNKLNNKIEKLIHSIISNGLSRYDEERIEILKQQVYAFTYNIILDIEADQDIFVPYYKYSESFQDLILLRSEIIELRIEEGKAKYSLNKRSKSNSLPSSISQKKVKRRIPKMITRQVERPDPDDPTRTIMRPQIVPNDPNIPEHWLEQLEIQEDVPTDRSKFRSHEKLSKMSSFSPSVKNLLGDKLSELPNKKRTDILRELKEVCNEMKDSITQKRFDRMSKKNLQLVITLGSGKNKRCYFVKNIYKVWEKMAKDDLVFKDPETRYKPTEEEKADIMKKIRYIDPKAPNPDLQGIKKDPKLNLEFVIFYHLDGANFDYIRVTRKYSRTHRYIFADLDLGYIPNNIEIEDVGAANYTSAAVKASLMDLFDKGRLLTNNFIPIRCCKIHLRKNINYWTEPIEGHEYKQGVNITRFKKMADEIYGLL